MRCETFCFNFFIFFYKIGGWCLLQFENLMWKLFFPAHFLASYHLRRKISVSSIFCMRIKFIVSCASFFCFQYKVFISFVMLLMCFTSFLRRIFCVLRYTTGFHYQFKMLYAQQIYCIRCSVFVSNTTIFYLLVMMMINIDNQPVIHSVSIQRCSSHKWIWIFFVNCTVKWL